MRATSLNFREIDKICSRFEEDWKPNLPLADVIRFVKSLAQISHDSFQKLALEIIQVDLELRWQNCADVLNAQFAEHLDATPRAMPTIPVWRDYLAALPELDLDDEDCGILSVSEWKARCKFGDAPSPLDYNVPESIIGKFNKMMPMVELQKHGQTQFESTFWNPLWVGRQAKSDPEPICLTSTDRQKLICAPGTDSSISRNQLRIDVQAGTVACVHNTSTNRQFTVNDQVIIQPGQHQIVTFPFFFDFDAMRIRCHREFFG